MFEIGPHHFTETDARSTVRKHPDIWALYARRRDAAAVQRVLAPLAPALTDDLAADLAAVWSAWPAASAALRRAGLLPARAEGVVQHLHLGDGGLPKRSTDRVEVGWRGVAGDRQASRAHHGRPWQALCIWSVEAIDHHQAAGHTVSAGLAGENITVAGLHWDDVAPGVRLQLGSVLCEVTDFAVPCKQNAAWFADGDFMAMHHERGPSRVYATVVEPGAISVGDPAILEP
jgi:hypothetical protein